MTYREAQKRIDEHERKASTYCSHLLNYSLPSFVEQLIYSGMKNGVVDGEYRRWDDEVTEEDMTYLLSKYKTWLSEEI